MTARVAGPSALPLVFVGGAVGTAVRYGVHLATAGSSWWVLLVNLTGALLLGLLLGALGRRADERAMRRRLLVGTGMIGAYTTYSTVAVAVVAPTVQPADWAAALVSLFLGPALAAVGLRVGGRHG